MKIQIWIKMCSKDKIKLALKTQREDKNLNYTNSFSYWNGNILDLLG